MFIANTKANSRPKRSGMSIVWLTIWSLIAWNPKVDSFGPAKTMMVMSNQTQLLKASALLVLWPVCSSALMAKLSSLKLPMEPWLVISVCINKERRLQPTQSLASSPGPVVCCIVPSLTTTRDWRHSPILLRRFALRRLSQVSWPRIWPCVSKETSETLSV